MDGSNAITQNIEGDPDAGDPNEMNINQELVSSIEERIDQAMPSLKQLAQFESMLQQNPQLAKMIASICPELILAFVQAAQDAQQDQTVQQGANGQPGATPQGGMVPSGGNAGATMPTAQPDENQQSGAMMMPGASQNGPTPPPAPTTTGNPPPSTPSASSPLRKQFYTGR